jgi:uncharacterized protein (TIGR02284 family)
MMTINPINTNVDANQAVKTLNRLIEMCMESDKGFYKAAEQIKNRGLKLLVKSYAEQRAQFALQLQNLAHQLGGDAPEGREPVISVERGWLDVKAAMIIQRQFRQQALLKDVLQHEDKTIQAYTEALQSPLPGAVQTVIQQQYDRIRAIRSQVASLTGQTARKLVVRLFNGADTARRVVDELQQAGFTADEIYAAPLDRIIQPYAADPQARNKSRKETVIATILSGMGFGLVFGIFVGLLQRFFFPEWGGLISPPGWGVMIEIATTVTLIGGFFGFVFGMLIGQDKAEEDEYLYTESLQEGDTLVVVFTDERNKAEAERVVGLQHQHEVKPMPA